MLEHRSDSGMPADSGTPNEAAARRLRARLAANALHAQRDSRTTTAKARAAFEARFEREVDPDGALDPAERRRRAANARAAYFARLSLAAAKSRRRRARGGDAA